MPGRDGTCPSGLGPMTGRGSGACRGSDSASFGRGQGMGFGSGRKFGSGTGYGNCGHPKFASEPEGTAASAKENAWVKHGGRSITVLNVYRN